MGLSLLLFATGAQAADAPLRLHPAHPFKVASAHVVPMPRERPPELIVAQATNPDPFNIQRTNNGPAPAPVSTSTQAPIVVTAPPAQSDSLLGYIWAAIGAIFTALFGKLAFKLPQIPGAPAAPATPAVDPNLRANIDAALLKAVQSGLPGQALQSGLGLIPGAAPLVSTLEPILRNIVIQELQKHVPAADASQSAAAPADPLQTQLTALTGIVQDLIKTHAAKPAGT